MIFKLGSNAMLALLGQINMALENRLLDKDNATPLAELQKHHKAIDLAVQQQLYSLDLGLQTFCHISTQLKRLEKSLYLPTIDVINPKTKCDLNKFSFPFAK
ncbi:hypothetical protein C0989_008081 [Termitomyces sp. Mn162]|nr:hypothetical protein C0989_008081 [Termitomyces sp. Mn162]